MKLSVALATHNEENNIKECLDSVKEIADEIVVVDGGSKDRTVDIAKSFGATVVVTDNPSIFHINKQKALDLARGEWILQLDADERVTPKLSEEIKQIISMGNDEIDNYQQKIRDKNLFEKHFKLLEERDGKIGKEGEYAAFFIPRLNFFLGKFLRYGGVYPDGVIRLVKRDKAYFPCKNVHEQMEVGGRVGWLENDLLHISDPTFARYLRRNSKYIDLIKTEMVKEKVGKDLGQFINYCLIKPIYWFVLTTLVHKGILDGLQGLIFSFFSALRFPRAYIRYLRD